MRGRGRPPRRRARRAGIQRRRRRSGADSATLLTSKRTYGRTPTLEVVHPADKCDRVNRMTSDTRHAAQWSVMTTLVHDRGAAAGADELYAAFSDWVAEQGITLYPAQDEAILELVTGTNVILATP